MVGNAAPPPSNEPDKPTTAGDVFSFIAFILGGIFIGGAVVVAYVGHLLGFF